MVCPYLKLTTVYENELNFGAQKCTAGIDSNKCPKSRLMGIPSEFCWMYKPSTSFIKEDVFSDNSRAYSVEAIRRKYPQAYEPWTKEDDEKLISEYKSGKTIKDLMELFGRQRGGINSRIKKLGIINP